MSTFPFAGPAVAGVCGLLLLARGFPCQGDAERQTAQSAGAFQSGRESLARRDLRAAVSSFTRAIAAQPDFARAYQYRGACRLCLWDFEGAIADLSTAIRLDGESAYSHALRCRALRLQGRHAEADRDAARLLTLLRARNAWRERRAARESQLFLNPKAFSKEEWQLLRDIGWRIGQPDHWREAWYSFAGVPSRHSGILLAFIDGGYRPKRPERYRALALCAQAVVDFVTEEKRLAEVVKTDSRRAEAFLCLGLARANRGEIEKALHDFETAIRLEPRYAEAYVFRGLARATMGDFDQAVADYTAALYLDPQCAPGLVYRYVAYEEQGKVEESLRDLETLLTRPPAQPAWNDLARERSGLDEIARRSSSHPRQPSASVRRPF